MKRRVKNVEKAVGIVDNTYFKSDNNNYRQNNNRKLILLKIFNNKKIDKENNLC